MKRDIFARKEISICDGNIYYVQQYPPFEGMKVLGELQKIIFPAIGGAATGFNIDGTLGAGLAGSLLNLSQNLDAENLEKITKLLLNPQYVSVKVEGEKSAVRLDEMKIAEIFTGRYFDMLVLCYEVAKENFFDTTLLCALPTGLVNALASIKQTFQANFQTNLNAQSSSTEQSSVDLSAGTM